MDTPTRSWDGRWPATSPGPESPADLIAGSATRGATSDRRPLGKGQFTLVLPATLEVTRDSIPEIESDGRRPKRLSMLSWDSAVFRPERWLRPGRGSGAKPQVRRSGGGRESNPPSAVRRFTGFEVRGRSCVAECYLVPPGVIQSRSAALFMLSGAVRCCLVMCRMFATRLQAT